MHSLRHRLLGIWSLSLVACVTVGWLFVQLHRQSSAAQVARAEAVVARACDLIRDRFDFYVSGWSGPPPSEFDARLRTDLATIVGLALAREAGVEGGVWQAQAGPLADAFPTDDGPGAKTGPPDAERNQIRVVNQLAARDEQSVDRQARAGAETLLLHACPLPGPISGLTGWTMARVRAVQGVETLDSGWACFWR